MNPILRQLLTALIVLIGFSGYSQTPVQITPQLIPPYSLQVSEYYSGVQPKLQVLLLNRDINQPTIQVKLRMNVESQNCRMRTKNEAVTPTFTLTSGIPYYLTPQDLQAFFAPANIDFSGGYNEQEYVQTGRLPEGLYTFYFEAYEVYSGNIVSNKGFTMGWLTLADPPMLNTPAKAEGVIPGTPQNVIFNWTPRHNTSPTAGYYTDYIISIAEYNDINVSPDASFTSSPPLFIDSVQTTTYLYNATKPQLVAGKRYAWRVQAKAKNGAQQLAMFRNNGFSEVFWFTYQNICPVPQVITATAQGQRVTIQWQANMQHMEYKVEYREKNNVDAQWFSMTNTRPSVTLVDLKPAKEYEYRVGGACQQDNFTFSSLYAFTTNAAGVNTIVTCGDTALPAAGGGPTLQTLAAGDTVKAGSFTVYVGHSSGTGSFTGMGYVIVPWLMNAKVEVKFTSITVSLDRKLLTGVIETTYDPTESGIDDIDEYIDIFTPGYNVGSVVTGEAAADTTFSFTIAQPNGIAVTLPSGYNPTTGTGTGGPISIIVTPAAGGGGAGPVTYTVPQLPTTLMDKDGNIYQVNQQGQVVSIGNKGGGTTMLSKANKKQVDADKAVVKFVAYNNSKVQYAFDEWKEIYKKSNTLLKEYERMGDYYVPAKAIAPGKTDYLKAIVTVVDANIKPDSIQFVNGKGTIYNKTRIENDSAGYRFEIAIVGGPEKDAQEIYALYPQGANKTLNLGKVLVASYAPRTRKLVLVPVRGAVINKDSVEQRLNRVYNKVSIKWEVTLDPNFDYNGWDLNSDGKLNVDGSSLFSAQTQEMKTLNNAYSNSRQVNPATAYLFVLSQAAETSNGAQVLGDMPRGKQFGYLFTGSGDAGLMAATAVHEVGHGVFALKHVFEYGEITQGQLTPANVMDYPAGEQLIKMQWDFIHDPAIVIGAFEKDEDAMNQIVVIDKTFLNTDTVSVSFMTQTGSIISLPFKDLYSVEFSYGAVGAPNQDIRQGLIYQFSIAPGLLRSFIIKTGTITVRYKWNEATKSYREEVSGNNYVYPVNYSLVDGFIFPMPCSDYYVMYKFRKGAYTQYAAGTGTSLDFSTLGANFQPFTSDTMMQPLKKNNVIIRQVIGSTMYEGCSWCRSPETSQMTGGSHCESPELWFIDKAAQLRNVFPEYFNKFTQSDERWGRPLSETYTSPGSGYGYGSSSYTIPATNWYWGQYLANNPQLVTDYTNKTNLRNYYATFCYKLRDFIDSSIIKAAQFWTDLNVNTPANTVLTYLNGEPAFQTVKAPLDKRELAIKILIGGNLPEPKEDAIIKILASVQDSASQRHMLDYLAAEVKIKTIFSKFNDFGGKDNYTKVISLLSAFIQNPEYNLEAYKLISRETNAQYVSVDLDLWDNRQTDGFKVEDNNTISFYNKVQLQKDLYDDPRYPAGTANQTFLTVPYNQMIPVDFWTEFELAGRVFKRKEIVNLPAMYAALVLDKAGAELFSKKAWLVVDGILLCVGAGEIKILFSAASWIRKAIIISNLTGSTLGIINELMTEDALPKSLRNKIRIGCMLLQAPDAVRGLVEVGQSLGKTAQEASEAADNVGLSIKSSNRERLLEFSTLVNVGTHYIDDAAELGKRVITFGQGDLAKAQDWLKAASNAGADNKAYVLAHAEGNYFYVLRKTGANTYDEMMVSHRSLAKHIESIPDLNGKEIVLLSCADLQTAENLSRKLGRKVYASDGSVSVHSDGGISSEKPFVQFDPNTGVRTPYNDLRAPGTGGNITKITLGGSWQKFIDDLDDSWGSLKEALRTDLKNRPDLQTLFATAPNKTELAEAWRLLRKSITNVDAANALYRNPDALEALARIRNNPSRAAMGLDDVSLSGIRGYGNATSNASYAEIINDLDALGHFLDAHPGTVLENFKPVISILTGDNNNYRQGIHWMIRNMSSDAQAFAGKKLNFNFTVKNADGNSAYLDIATDDDPIRMIEFKSGPGSVKQETIVDQFINRDMLNARNLDQISWRLTGRNLTKQELINYLTSASGKKALEKLLNNSVTGDKMRLWFGLSSLETTISNVKIGDFVGANFNTIFKNY